MIIKYFFYFVKEMYELSFLKKNNEFGQYY